MLDLDLIRKNNELCLVGESRGRFAPEEVGLFLRDTRFLDRLAFEFAGQPLVTLEVQTPAPDHAIITATNPEMRRPHYCLVVFGSGIKPLRVIITSLNVRYTMFGNDGTPLRAVCTVQLEEARIKSSFANQVAKAGVDAVKSMGRAAFEAVNAFRS